jgi:hypothetical protein
MMTEAGTVWLSVCHKITLVGDIGNKVSILMFGEVFIFLDTDKWILLKYLKNYREVTLP